MTLLRCLPGASGQAKELAPCKNLCLESSVMVWGSARGYRKVFRCLSYCHDVVVRLLLMNTETMQGEGSSRRGKSTCVFWDWGAGCWLIDPRLQGVCGDELMSGITKLLAPPDLHLEGFVGSWRKDGGTQRASPEKRHPECSCEPRIPSSCNTAFLVFPALKITKKLRS